MTLLEEVNQKSKEIHTDGYPMSIGEIASLYKDKEIDIHPEFQRIFRWNILQKSKLIESILLGIPIPSIFVSQREDGVWDVIDGLQRLSTIFEFMGILRDEDGELIVGSTLIATTTLPTLKNKKWDNIIKTDELDNSLKIEFKRVKIDIKIVKKQSDKNIKYELFQRINTLGSRLSDQDVRNCLLIMINKDFYFWLKELAEYPAFIESLSLADRLIDEQYHMELALRFFIYKNIDLTDIKGVYDLAEFVTNKMIAFANNSTFDLEKEKEIFDKTFTFINSTVGDDAFKRYNIDKDVFQGKFLLSLFECIAVGIGKNMAIKDVDFTPEVVRDKAKQLWITPNFQAKTGSGVNVTTRLPFLLPLGEKLFKQ